MYYHGVKHVQAYTEPNSSMTRIHLAGGHVGSLVEQLNGEEILTEWIMFKIVLYFYLYLIVILYACNCTRLLHAHNYKYLSACNDILKLTHKVSQ